MLRIWTWIRDEFGGGATRRLPERVREELMRRQENAEILISIFQLFAVLAIAAIYFGSQRPTDQTDFSAVPVALAGYGTFTLFRLALTAARRCPWPVLVLSVFVDVGILYLTLWSFHQAYGQDAAFVLKSPSILYVFVLIAIRMIRFEPFYVLLTGTVAALGWFGLAHLCYAVHPHATHSYLDYVNGVMTENGYEGRILWGAEYEKIFHMVVVTISLVTAQFLARRTLVRAVTGQVVTAELSRFFPPAIAQQIASADNAITAGHGQVRNAAILTMDLRGFTPLTRRLPPDEVMKLLHDYQSRLVPVIHRNGGSVDKFLGDGILATFGAAMETNTYAADVLRTVDELQAEVTAWNEERQQAGHPPVNVGMAVASGPVIFGAVGEQNRLEYTVIGDAVNLAAKLEKQTKVEQCRALTTRHTLEQAQKQGYEPRNGLEERAARPVGGVNEPVDLVVLLPAERLPGERPTDEHPPTRTPEPERS